MPELVEEYDWTVGVDNLYRATRYPYDEWFDGRIRKMTRGEDFTVNTKSFVKALTHRAKEKHGGRVRYVKVSEDQVVVQFLPPREQPQEVQS